MSLGGEGGHGRPFGFNHTKETKEKMSVSGKLAYLKGKPKPKSMKGKTVYSIWLTKYGKEEADKRYKNMVLKLKEQRKGIKNGMFGKTFYSIWVEKYGIEEANRKEKERSEKIRLSRLGKPSNRNIRKAV
jgi:hypothetical protein